MRHRRGKGALAGPAYEALRTTKRSSEHLTRRWASGLANFRGSRGARVRQENEQPSEPERWERVEGGKPSPQGACFQGFGSFGEFVATECINTP